MGPKQKAFTVAMWACVVIGLFVLIALTKSRSQRHGHATPGNAAAMGLTHGSTPSSHPSPIDLAALASDGPVDVEFKAPTFALTDAAGQPFKSEALNGKVWTAMLFFSQCQGVCPGMRARVEKLQETVTDERVHFVSFTVDPERDTPERLADYAKAAQADPARWHMLTGPSEQMHAIAAAVMLPYDVPQNHSSRILLVDAQGTVRRIYASSQDTDMQQLAIDAKRLAETGKL